MSQIDSYDPYEEMKNFYRLDDPTEDEQFRFVEAMKYLIDTAFFEDDIIAFSYNLAMYYRDIRNFHLEGKYLELGEKHGSEYSKEQMGFLWYYGLDREQDYGKAYKCFSECGTRRGQYMIADMYHYGQYVKLSLGHCRSILEDLFEQVESERHDERFVLSTLFPEISLRLVDLNCEQEEDEVFDLDCLFDARRILTIRQSRRPFWGNLRTMRGILETTAAMVGNDYDYIDLYDLMTLEPGQAAVMFDFNGSPCQIDVSTDEDGVVYMFDGKYYRGADGFLEKARIGGKRITSAFDLISDIEVVR